MSDRSKETEQQLFADLKVLSDSAFPKQCSTCGRIYNSPEDFFRHSNAPTFGSGLKGSWDDDDRTVVELFRNCECGSTLMDFFMDRRDRSSRGLKRRTVFGRLLDTLEAKGLSREIARQELTGVMNGNQSERLEAFGIRLKTGGS
ncbi:hypothetical protein [Saccharospirillum impatiens]|uniref:hypothetical protein n=1 Tax=Saccharospirillum impatiens TaxID=169438 RepID=UPI000422550E|nr:hypothetical protein [Saccharospirillum impatiens]